MNRNIQPTPQALEWIHPELEYRMRYVIQEAWKLARRCRRTVLLREDILNAHAILTGTLHTQPWAPVPAIDSFGLSEATLSARADGLLAGGIGGGLDAALAAGHSREAVALLQSVQAAVRSGDFGASAHLLQTLSTAADAPALRRLVPAMVSVLRAEAETSIAAASAAAGAGVSDGKAFHSGVVSHLSAVLHLVDALVANPALPVEACGDDLLALVTSLVIHRAPAGAATKPSGSSPAAASSSADATNNNNKQPFPVRAANHPLYATIGGACASDVIEHQLRLRALTSRVLSQLVLRLEGGAHVTQRHFSGDDDYDGHTDRGSSAIRQPLAQLLTQVLTMSPSAVASHAAALAGGSDQPEEVDEDNEGDVSMGAGGAASSSASRFPPPSPSVYGAVLALSCVGPSQFKRYFVSDDHDGLMLPLMVAWSQIIEDRRRPAHERAWAQHCVVALQRIAARMLKRSGSDVVSNNSRKRSADGDAAPAAAAAQSSATAASAGGSSGGAKRVVAVTLLVAPSAGVGDRKKSTVDARAKQKGGSGAASSLETPGSSASQQSDRPRASRRPVPIASDCGDSATFALGHFDTLFAFERLPSRPTQQRLMRAS